MGNLPTTDRLTLGVLHVRCNITVRGRVGVARPINLSFRALSYLEHPRKKRRSRLRRILLSQVKKAFVRSRRGQSPHSNRNKSPVRLSRLSNSGKRSRVEDSLRRTNRG